MSSLSFRKASASSISKVGPHISIDLNNAAAVILLANMGLQDILPIISSSWVLPQRFSGAVITAKGATCTTSINHVMTTHKAAAWAVSGGQTMKRLIVVAISVRSSSPLTDSSHGSVSGKRLSPSSFSFCSSLTSLSSMEGGISNFFASFFRTGAY